MAQQHKQWLDTSGELAMTLPIELRYTYHKYGGRIIRITRIGHTCDKPEDGRSRDYWYFIGDVNWSDGTMSDNIEIPPYALCYEDEQHRDEVLALSELMSDYLLKHGDWYRDEKCKHQGWYANVRPEAKVRRRA